MASLNTYNLNNGPASYEARGFHSGFTLIEILVVIAIIGMVLSFGLTIDINTLRGDTFQAEINTIVSVLERARSQSMANLSDANHGVCYIEPNYIIFTGDTCTADDSEIIPANTDITSNASTTLPAEIVFERLTGRTTGATIHISHGVNEADIIINDEGTINW